MYLFVIIHKWTIYIIIILELYFDEVSLILIHLRLNQ